MWNEKASGLENRRNQQTNCKWYLQAEVKKLNLLLEAETNKALEDFP